MPTLYKDGGGRDDTANIASYFCLCESLADGEGVEGVLAPELALRPILPDVIEPAFGLGRWGGYDSDMAFTLTSSGWWTTFEAREAVQRLGVRQHIAPLTLACSRGTALPSSTLDRRYPYILERVP